MVSRANTRAQCSQGVGSQSCRWFNGRVGPDDEYLDDLRRIEAAEETDVVERALTAARERLGMDAAYVGTFDEHAQTILAVVGDSNASELQSGGSIPLEETYCVRMLSGQIPNVVPDTRADPAVQDMRASSLIGAYVGVPVILASGEVHGTLCCVSSAARPDLGAEELRFMFVLAEIVARRVDQAKTDLARLTGRFRAADPAT